MGQIVLGVMLGIKVPAKLKRRLTAENSDYETIIYRWNDEVQVSEGPSVEWSEDGSVLGTWVACAHGDDMLGEHVLGLDSAISFEALAKSKHYKIASKAWLKFAIWLDKEYGIELPTPRLFVAPTEVA